jgi:hypothetical protein
MPEIIIDKSYLDAANRDQINSLYTKHSLLMPEVLFYELMTTREESMKRCFSKFPARTNPVELIPNIGTLLRYELDTRQACTPIYERRLNITFEFNSLLRDGTFSFTEEQRKAKEEEEKIVKEKTQEFFELAMMVWEFLPHLNGIPCSTFPKAVKSAKQELASNEDKVRQIYRQLMEYRNTTNAIDDSAINHDWAHFRWLQIRLIYSLDLLLSYKGKLPESASPKFWRRMEHDMLDAEYITLAALTGGLACNESKMLAIYKLVCPDGIVLRC